MRDFRTSRRLYHHVALGLLSAMLLAGLYYAMDSADAKYKCNMSTACVSLLLLGGTWLTVPLNELRRQRNPVSTDLRRDIGKALCKFGDSPGAMRKIVRSV